MENEIQESIKQTQLLWDFEEVIRLKKELTIINFNYFDDYIKYLADCGKLDVIYREFEALEPSLLYKILNSQKFPVCKYLYYLIKNKILSVEQEKDYKDISAFLTKIERLNFSGEFKKVSELLNKDFKNYFNDNASAQDNMIFNHIINNLIEVEHLSVPMLINISYYVLKSKNINTQRKKYLAKTLIDYCLTHHTISTQFFKLRDQYYNHLQIFLTFLSYFNNIEVGAANLVEKIYFAIKQFNDLNLITSNHKPKIAICISGICKGSDYIALESLNKYIAKPLQADLFIHTWDVRQIWSGASRPQYFWKGMFGILPENIPTQLNNLDFLKNNFPQISTILLSNICCNTNEEELRNILSFKSLLIENENEFLTNNDIDERYASRGHLNQIKMIYGMYKSLDLMQKYEKETGIEYDYIIRARPDTIFSKELELDKITSLQPNSIGNFMHLEVGPSDAFFFAARETYEVVIKNLWDTIINSKKLSPFEHFPKYDAHALMLTWCIVNNIKLTYSSIFFSFAQTFQHVKIPGLKNALDTDLKKTKRNKKLEEERNWLSDFLKDKSL